MHAPCIVYPGALYKHNDPRLQHLRCQMAGPSTVMTEEALQHSHDQEETVITIAKWNPGLLGGEKKGLVTTDNGVSHRVIITDLSLRSSVAKQRLSAEPCVGNVSKWRRQIDFVIVLWKMKLHAMGSDVHCRWLRAISLCYDYIICIVIANPTSNPISNPIPHPTLIGIVLILSN